MRLICIMEAQVDGRPVALARMLMSFSLAVCVLETAALFTGIANGKLQYPAFPGIPAPSVLAVQICTIVGLLAAACLLIGLFASAAAATGSALLAGALLWDQQAYSSHHLLVTLLLAYLAFARSGSRWGIAASKTPGGAGVPWWPQLLMLTQVTVLYFFAAVSKINPRFLSGEPLQSWMWIELPLWVFQSLAVATVVTELFLAAALWIPRLRLLAVAAGIGLHISIVVGLADQTLALAAFAAASLSAYGLFITRPPLRALVVDGDQHASTSSPAASRGPDATGNSQPA